MEFEFSGKYEKEEYFKAIYLAGKPSTRSLITRITIFLVLLILAVAYAYISSDSGNLSGMKLSRLIKFGIYLPILAYFIFQPFINIRLTSTRLWNDPVIRSHVSGNVSNMGIQYGQHMQNWETFSRKFISEDRIVLLTNDRIMACLPRHFFQNPDDWRRICQIVDSKVVEAKY